MSCKSCITNRDTQNRDTPNLPFAQELITYQGNINPDRPNLPFAQSSRARNVYIVYWKDGQQTEMVLTESMVNHYTNLGHRVVLKSLGNGNGDDVVKPIGSPHWTKSEIEDIFKAYYGDDIQQLHDNMDIAGKQMIKDMQENQRQRDRIEARIMSATEKQDIHDKLKNLGTSVSDVSSGLSAHELLPHNIIDIPNPIGDILPYILIGGVALYAIGSRRKR